jgi:hypothetical protein
MGVPVMGVGMDKRTMLVVVPVSMPVIMIGM